MLQRRVCLDRAQAMMEELKPQFQHFLKVFKQITHFIGPMLILTLHLSRWLRLLVMITERLCCCRVVTLLNNGKLKTPDEKLKLTASAIRRSDPPLRTDLSLLSGPSCIVYSVCRND